MITIHSLKRKRLFSIFIQLNVNIRRQSKQFQDASLQSGQRGGVPDGLPRKICDGVLCHCKVRSPRSRCKPPVYDLPAIQAHIGQLSVSRYGLVSSLEISPQDFPRLSAAVEVATYRIVLEALTNVITHILIVDDHTLFREGVRAILKSVADFEIVGEAATGGEAIDLVSALTPDIILMDIQMPDMNGVEATRKILNKYPQIGIIMLTMLEDDDFLFSALQAGARGYVLKGADKAEMVRSIRAVASGEALFGPAIANRLTKFFNSPAVKKQSPFPELTSREFEVLELIAQTYNNHEIAQMLNISPKTVSNHISNIFSKLQVSDRTEAIFKARDAGLGKSK